MDWASAAPRALYVSQGESDHLIVPVSASLGVVFASFRGCTMPLPRNGQECHIPERRVLTSYCTCWLLQGWLLPH